MQVDAKLTKLKAGAGEVVTATTNFHNANLPAKVTAEFAVSGAVDDAIEVIKSVYDEGATLCKQNWPQL